MSWESEIIIILFLLILFPHQFVAQTFYTGDTGWFNWSQPLPCTEEWRLEALDCCWEDNLSELLILFEWLIGLRLPGTPKDGGTGLRLPGTATKCGNAASAWPELMGTCAECRFRSSWIYARLFAIIKTFIQCVFFMPPPLHILIRKCYSTTE